MVKKSKCPSIITNRSIIHITWSMVDIEVKPVIYWILFWAQNTTKKRQRRKLAYLTLLASFLWDRKEKKESERCDLERGVCVCVCERERERERVKYSEAKISWFCMFLFLIRFWKTFFASVELTKSLLLTHCSLISLSNSLVYLFSLFSFLQLLIMCFCMLLLLLTYLNLFECTQRCHISW